MSTPAEASSSSIEVMTPDGVSSNPRGPTIERVFPIRIQTHVDIASLTIPPTLHASHESVPSQTGSTEELLPDSGPFISYFDPVAPSFSIPQPPEGTSPQDIHYVTNRSNFVLDGEDGSAITSSPGQKIYRCEDEPIHIPGAIQSFGALLAVRETEGIFTVRIVSENIYDVVGIKPDHLFELRCFTDTLTQNDRKSFGIRAHERHNDQSRKNPDIFPISLTPLTGAPVPLFCAMHYNSESDLFICEFELERDVFHSPDSPNDTLPDNAIKTVHHEVDESQRLLSTTNRSKPVRALEVARKMSQQPMAMDLFHILSEIQDQLGSAESLSELLDIIVGLVYGLTGFHRVMIYQFDEAAAGSVVSEILNPQASEDIYRGLHFPASDIPKQARELYIINKIRVLYNRDQETARLICRTFDDAKTPLDLTHSYLRAMSPVHLKYLSNMGVQASMSISLIVNDSLWGLVSCHNYGSGSGTRITLPMREVCRGLGNIASGSIEKLINLSRIQARRSLTNTSAPKNSPFTYITSSSTDLLKMFSADFGFLAIRNEARTIGKLEAYSESIALLQYIRRKSFTGLFHTNYITRDCSDIDYAPGFSVLSGMLVVPLSLPGSEFLVFMRKGQLKNITWAGNPYEKINSPGTSYLKPRSSFKRWSESVIGMSREWSEDSIDSATLLSLLYGRFIDVWRQKEAIVQRNRMTRLLIRNAGHEVRTPLNSIINYLELALEEELDERAYAHLYRSLEASKSLVFVVNDLLNLTEAEETVLQIQENDVDLKSTVSEVIAAFKDEATRRGLEIDLDDDPTIPPTLRCNSSGLRQIISNLLANSIKSSKDSHIRIILKQISSTDSSLTIQITFKDEGSGFSEEQLDSIFQDFEQILDDDENAPSMDLNPNVSTPRTINIGLGLATTARFVRLNHGQISMASAGIGRGTEVRVALPFRKALEVNPDRRRISLPTPPQDNPLHLRHDSGSFVSIDSGPTLQTPTTLSSSSNSPQLDATPTTVTSPGKIQGRWPFPLTIRQEAAIKLNVLVAEDNPLNSRLLETRLRRSGHDVRIAVDGQACFENFSASPAPYDVVLMDIQMPLIDGIEATRLIRAFEKDIPKPNPELSSSPSLPTNKSKRIPIIAVSASLAEQRIDEYITAGFDGWILKPIDFKRLEVILAAIHDFGAKKSILYGVDRWERGGWFDVDLDLPEPEPIT